MTISILKNPDDRWLLSTVHYTLETKSIYLKSLNHTYFTPTQLKDVKTKDLGWIQTELKIFVRAADSMSNKKKYVGILFSGVWNIC